MKQLPIHELANIVPMASEIEQEALNNSILTNGFDTDLGYLLLWNGEIVDGRCRQQACINAGLDPSLYAKELGNLPYEEVSQKVLALNTRRNLTDTQKAISAYKLSKEKGHTQESASKHFSTTVRQVQTVGSIIRSLENPSLSYTNIYYGVKTKQGVRFYSYQNPPMGGFTKGLSNPVIQGLLADYSLRVLLADGKKTSSKSIKEIAKRLKLLIEEQELIVEETSFEWNPDGNITTEAGKEFYYTLVNNRELPIDILIELVHYTNLKFKLPELSELSHSPL